MKTKITKNPLIELEEVGIPHKLKWNKCKLETIAFGHGITTTPLQATALYAAMINGGNLVKPSLIQNHSNQKVDKIISKNTSDQLKTILRKVVSSENGTASLADMEGYNVGGKTGTAESYGNKKIELILSSLFPLKSQIYSFRYA